MIADKEGKAFDEGNGIGILEEDGSDLDEIEGMELQEGSLMGMWTALEIEVKEYLDGGDAASDRTAKRYKTMRFIVYLRQGGRGSELIWIPFC